MHINNQKNSVDKGLARSLFSVDKGLTRSLFSVDKGLTRSVFTAILLLVRVPVKLSLLKLFKCKCDQIPEDFFHLSL